MAKLYDGNVLIMVALADQVVGDVVEFGESVGIVQTEGLTGASISVDTVGVYEFDGANADAIAVGDVLYFDGTYVTTTSTDNTLCGVAWSTKAGTTDGVVEVKIG